MQRRSLLGWYLRSPLAGRMALAILVAVCAVAAHQATYLVGAGAEEATDVAHDAYWAPLVATVLISAAALALVTVRELRRLSAHAGRLDHGPDPGRGLRAYSWSVGVLWLRLGFATAIVYAVQENLERMAVGLAPSGLDALATHGLLPILVVLVASLAVAAVASLVRWRCETLLARLGRRAAPRRRATRTARPLVSSRIPRHLPPDACGSRAPPVGVLAA